MNKFFVCVILLNYIERERKIAKEREQEEDKIKVCLLPFGEYA